MQQGEKVARPTAALRAPRKQLAQPDKELFRKAEKEVAKPTADVVLSLTIPGDRKFSMRINHKHFVYTISLPELAWKKCKQTGL